MAIRANFLIENTISVESVMMSEIENETLMNMGDMREDDFYFEIVREKVLEQFSNDVDDDEDDYENEMYYVEYEDDVDANEIQHDESDMDLAMIYRYVF
jgi:hypothetical protein